MANLCDIPYPRYVDDLFAADPDGSEDGKFEHTGPAGTASLARWVVETLRGWELDASPEKQYTNAASFTALGVEVGKGGFD